MYKQPIVPIWDQCITVVELVSFDQPGCFSVLPQLAVQSFISTTLSQFWAIICMMDIQAWGSECVRTMTGLTVLWGILSMIVAYLVLALVDRWILQRGRKGPVQWPILGNGQSYFQCLPLFKFLYLCCASYVRFQVGFSMYCFYENYCILSSVLPVYNWIELIRIVIKV